MIASPTKETTPAVTEAVQQIFPSNCCGNRKTAFDMAQAATLHCQPSGNSSIGFSSLNQYGGHKATVKRASFFVSDSGLHSWWLGAGGFGLLGSILTSLLTRIQPPFLFSSGEGEQHQYGGSL